MKTFLVVLVTFVFCSCFAQEESTDKIFYSVSVRSLKDADTPMQKYYHILPGDKGISEGDIEFKEFARQIKFVLRKKGYIERTIDKAQFVIFLTYGIGEPQVDNYSFTFPEFGKIGGSTTTFSAHSWEGMGSTVTGEMTQEPTYGVTGYDKYSGSVTTYTRYMILDAYDLQGYKWNGKTENTWRTYVVSSGRSDDLENVFTYLVVASENYINNKTNGDAHLRLEEEDEGVNEVRQ